MDKNNFKIRIDRNAHHAEEALGNLCDLGFLKDWHIDKSCNAVSVKLSDETYSLIVDEKYQQPPFKDTEQAISQMVELECVNQRNKAKLEIPE